MKLSNCAICYIYFAPPADRPSEDLCPECRGFEDHRQLVCELCEQPFRPRLGPWSGQLCLGCETTLEGELAGFWLSTGVSS